MTKEPNVVGIDPGRDVVESAVSKLREASFDVSKLSIIGEDYLTDEKVVGYHPAGERMKSLGIRGAFWGGIWGLLFGAGFFWFPVSAQYWWPDLS
jgi:hypothetical protein